MASWTGGCTGALLAAAEDEEAIADERDCVLRAGPQHRIGDACSSDDDSDEGGAHLLSGWAARSTVVVGIIALTSATASVIGGALWSTGCSWFLRSHTVMHTTSELVEGAVYMAHQDPCDKYINLNLVSTEYSNLGHRGPDLTYPEGISWKVEPDEHNTSNVGHRELLVRASASDGYKPFSPAINGMRGKYASINLQGGSAVNLTFTVQDANSKNRVALPSFSLTFFDLGTDPLSNAPIQSITLSNFWKFFRDEMTAVDVSKHAGGSATFAGRTHVGSSHDIVDPMLLGAQQLQYAVSVVYRQTSEVHCQLYASPGQTPRLFTFAFGPLVLCPSKTADLRPPLRDLDWMPPLEVPVMAGPDETFLQWLVEKGETVRKGDEICSVKRLGGDVKIHKAPCDGVIQRMHLLLRAHDQLNARLSEKTLAVIARFKIDALKLPHGDAHTAVARQRTFFDKYTVKVNDFIRADAVIAITHDEAGRLLEVRSPVQGVVLQVQPQIAKGDPVEIVFDRSLAIIGRLPPLQLLGGETPVIAPHNTFFARWHLSKGDFVEKGEPVCFVRNAQGAEIPVVAPRDGMVYAMQHHLPQGVVVDALVQDRTLATLGPLPPLEVQLGDAPARVPRGSDWLFDSWKVKVGSRVVKGDVIALVRQVHGSKRAVLAGKVGRVSAMQEHLRKGSNIGEIIQDCNIAVISKFQALVASKGQFAIEVSTDAVFKCWHVPHGAFVEKGSIVAEVFMINRSVMIPSPGAGVIVKFQPLVSGESITAQQHGCNIALLDRSHPGWAVHLRMLAWACCGLAATLGLLYVWSRKHKKACNYNDKQKRTFRDPFFAPSVSDLSVASWSPSLLDLPAVNCDPHAHGTVTNQVVETPPRPATSDDEEPVGVRLDFAHGVELHTVYAQHKPLGITHDCIQPATVAGFFCNSYASTLGVQQGWRLARIQDQELKEGSSCEDTLESHLAELPIWPLRLAFKSQAARDDNATTVCSFTEQPLGLFLASKVPKVSRVCAGSPAHAAGIKEGWYLVSIGEQSVPIDRNAKDTANMLREAVALLPNTGRKFGPTPWRPWSSPSRF